MILFDLRCGAGHVFEGWFASSNAYEDQRTRGLLCCPICGDAAVDKAVMAPRVAPKGNSAPVPVGGTHAQAKAALARMAEIQSRMLQGSRWVGDRFAAEARAAHEAGVDKAAIHGQATLAEARALADDGIPIAPLPLPVRPPGADN